MSVPASTGLGAPGTQPAPASLARSPLSGAPASSSPSSIPFVRGSSLATMQDYSASGIASGASPTQIQLQTNAFLAYVVMDFALTTAGNSANVTFNATSSANPIWNIIASFSLNDPANQAIITPITGYGLYILNKYLLDTGCFFDPQLDANYSLTTTSLATGGSFSFRLVVPIEHRRRDALGAVNNSAANQRYLINITWIAAWATVYGTAPSIPGTLALNLTQVYWTAPPASVTTSAGTTAVQQTPNGLTTVGFVRYERHNEVSGGGSPQIQLNNVGDYLSGVLFVLRSNSNAADQADWPSPFNWWVNDYQVHALSLNVFQRELGRFYRYTNAIGTSGGLDTGVFPLWILGALFDRADNFTPASQYLPTDATTKLQIRGSTFGASASYLEVYTRAIRPSSGAALFA